MNGNEKRRERIGNVLLVLAAAASVVAVGFLLVEHRLGFGSEIAFGVTGALLLAFVIVEPARTRTWVTSRQVRYGSNAVVMTLVLLVILGVGNFLADRHPYPIDVTANRSLSLSPQTVDLLRTLEGPIQIVAFFTNPTTQEQAADLLDQYAYHYPELQLEFHDPLVEPSRAAEWGITEVFWGSRVFIVYQGRQETIYNVSEREVTSALVRLTRETQPVVYFLTGHGEPQLSDTQELGLGTVQERLAEEGFQVSSLNLLITATVPADASAVVLVGPQRPLGQDEVDRLAAYLDDGGAAMILLDPAPDPETESPELAGWLAERWGVAFRNDIVLDFVSYVYPMPTFPLAASYGHGPIGRGMAGVGTYFIEARSIAQVDTAAGPSFTPVVQTSARSWGEVSWDELELIPDSWPQYDEGVDATGPLDIAVTLEDSRSGARLVLFGDSHFCANLAVLDLGNGDLFINALNWLTEDEELISIRPQADVDRYVTIRSALVRNGLFAILVLLIPLSVGGGGAVVFVVRRLRR